MWPVSRAGSQICSCVSPEPAFVSQPSLPAGVGTMVQQSVRRHLGNGSAFDRDQIQLESRGYSFLSEMRIMAECLTRQSAQLDQQSTRSTRGCLASRGFAISY